MKGHISLVRLMGIVGFAATVLLGMPLSAWAQTPIPGSDHIDSEWTYVEGLPKTRQSFRLEVHWDIADRGPTGETVTKTPALDNICAIDHAGHDECPKMCGIHNKDVTATEKNKDFKELKDQQEMAHRASLAQNREIGSQDSSFESTTVSAMTAFTQLYKGKSITVTGKASKASCAFTSHTWEFHRYVLHIHWDWYKTVQTLTPMTLYDPKTKKLVTFNQWSDPVTTGPLDVAPTDADIMQVVMLDENSDKPLDIIVCHCAKKSEDKKKAVDEKKVVEDSDNGGQEADVLSSLQHGAVNQDSQNEMVRKNSKGIADAAPSGPQGSPLAIAWTAFCQLVMGWFVQPLSAFAPTSHTGAPPVVRQAHSGDIVAFSSAAAAGAASAVEVSLIATGNSTGDAFRLETRGPSGKPIAIGIPDGLVLQPLKQAAVPANQKGMSGVWSESVTGYCLNYAKLPPAAGMLYRVADEATQRQFAPVARVMQAGKRLADSGQLHPDTDPAAYADSITQWAMWSRIERWTTDDLQRHFVEYTRKNAEAAGKRWTKDLEQQVRQLFARRMPDIAAVQAAADAGGPAGH